jgi:hypothetical protein
MFTTCTNIPHTYVHTYRHHMMREPRKEKEVWRIAFQPVLTVRPSTRAGTITQPRVEQPKFTFRPVNLPNRMSRQTKVESDDKVRLQVVITSCRNLLECSTNSRLDDPQREYPSSAAQSLDQLREKDFGNRKLDSFFKILLLRCIVQPFCVLCLRLFRQFPQLTCSMIQFLDWYLRYADDQCADVVLDFISGQHVYDSKELSVEKILQQKGKSSAQPKEAQAQRSLDILANLLGYVMKGPKGVVVFDSTLSLLAQCFSRLSSSPSTLIDSKPKYICTIIAPPLLPPLFTHFLSPPRIIRMDPPLASIECEGIAKFP